MSPSKARRTRVKSRRVRGDRTKARILDAAERLFAESGYDGVSLRALAEEADAQLALIHYHFGNKLDVYRAVWARWFPPVDMSKPTPGRPELPPDQPLESNVRRFVEWFFAPLITLFQTPRGRHILTILGREISDPKEAGRGILRIYLDPRVALLVDEIHTLMPRLTKGEVSLAYNMMAGIANSVFVNHARISRMSNRALKIKDMVESLPDVIAFVIGGWMNIYNQSTSRGSQGAESGRSLKRTLIKAD
jgi:AcrR family transcriptional regulator